MTTIIVRYRIKIKGIVQGVGFRPFIYNLAKKHNLTGWVVNSSSGVVIEVEGDLDNLQKFTFQIKNNPPPRAVIEKIEIENNFSPMGYQTFEIRESVEEVGQFVPVSPDISICSDCLNELFDPADRRYLYPFINCTNCGPRFTITKDIPYDRKNTTMVRFQMCATCQKEYDDPTDRRFHAQPNACYQCGPSLELRNHHKRIPTTDPIAKTIKLLMEGKIIAIKGLGGFHLACDAQNDHAIKELRKRKLRTFKPFAIMSYDIETIEKFCWVNSHERKILSSFQRPIVLLRAKPNCLISSEVAPFNKYLGVMLPYTPLHYLLLKNWSQMGKIALVMTSGNLSEEPICMTNDEALRRLKDLADFYLFHDRDIQIRCDDSVAMVFEEKEILIRRSRGFAPQPIYLSSFEAISKSDFVHQDVGILACGAELKNTFTLAKGNTYFISQHIGDLENLETYNFFCETIDYFKKFFRIEPSVIVYDLHPDYLSTRYALSCSKLKLIGVQHHHAHMVSCMVDNNLDLTKPVIGVIFDGTGYGLDGKIWGGEFLVGNGASFQRRGHLKYIPIPGGEVAIKHPYRMALSFLYSLYGKDYLNLDLDFIGRINQHERDIIIKQIEKGINAPLSSSCGRLFDAVSSLIGLRDKITYEAQAAIELEMVADENVNDYYQWEIKAIAPDLLIIDPSKIFQGIIENLKKKISQSIISAKFHNTVAYFIAEVCQKIRKKENLNKVVLSGGVFQNRLLLARTLTILRKEGFEVFFHQRIPTNDGGISLGQAAIATIRLFSEK